LTVRVVVSPWNIVTYPHGGGHWWVPLQYVRGLQDLGAEVWWMEEYGRPNLDPASLRLFTDRMTRLGLIDRCIVWKRGDADAIEVVVGREADMDRLVDSADVLLNFNYEMPIEIVDRFSVAALVDIDPGLFQHWTAEGQLSPSEHQRYVTVGETVGTSAARFPDLDVDWIRIRPPVHLPSWPVHPVPEGAAYTTVSQWWGDDEWILERDGTVYDNNKRAAFLAYLDLPSHVPVKLELALNLALAADTGRVGPDDAERDLLEQHGWTVSHAYHVAGDPFAYRRYIEASAGEFSVVKPSCIRFQNAWISDRTICYLATGRPAVVQHTGPSELLPDDEGLFRFADIDGAVSAFEELERRPQYHARAARALVEEQFDSSVVLGGLLSELLDSEGT
jgi:hypothetical protein